MARLIIGLTIPLNYFQNLKTADFLWKVGPIDLESDNGAEYLVLNARFSLGVPMECFRKSPKLRLRQQVLVDAQAWFARHAARPGFVSV